MKTETIYMIGLFILLGIVVWLIVMGKISENNACKEIGFQKGVTKGGMKFCEDIEGNLHYIKLDCDFPPFTKCEAKPILVGDVRSINPT